jgi:hypothetical protein
MSKMKVLICPYCGDTQAAGDRCRVCGGLFEPLSRQATHNAMGPWFVRDDSRPFQPGASYETIVKLIERGQITKYSILRSPTTKQFWTVAKRVPGVAHVLGYCHNCDASVDPGDHGCHACGVPFGAYLDRNFMGLPDVRPLPWEAGGGDDEQHSMASASPRVMEFRRAAEPIGISSFASDEELRSSGLSPIPAHASHAESTGTLLREGPYAETRMGRTAAAAFLSNRQSAEADSPSAEALDPSEELVARAMQRRVRSQQHTIRILMIAVIVLAVLMIVSLAAFFAAKTKPSASQSVDQRKHAPARSTAVPSPSDVGEAKSSKPAATTSSTLPATSDAAADAAEIDFEAELARANELIGQGEQSDRALNERISDYEEALKLLKGIQENAPASRRPSDLNEQIANVQRELERLRLKEFFP